MAAGQKEKGTEHLRIAADLREDIQLLLALRYAALNEPKLAEVAAGRAEKVFEGKLREQPNNVETRIQYVGSLILREKFAEAVDALQQGIKLSPDDKLRRQLAMTYAAGPTRCAVRIRKAASCWTCSVRRCVSIRRTPPL
jgi:hypothetical protein